MSSSTSTSLAKAFIAVDTVLLVLAVLSVALRFYTRRRTSLNVLQDDWLVVAALVFAATVAAVNIAAVPVGHVGKLATINVPLSKLWYANQVLYIIAVGLVKLSLLALYQRVFRAASRTPTSIGALAIVSVLWVLVFIVLTLLQFDGSGCRPINCTPACDDAGCTLACDVEGCKLNFSILDVYIATSATNIFLDLAILVVPILYVRKLQLPLSKRVAVGGIFGLGFFCVVASIARLVYTIKYKDAILGYGLDDWTIRAADAMAKWMLWSGIEASVSTICASLPCYGPLLAWNRLRGLDISPAAAAVAAAAEAQQEKKKKLSRRPTLDSRHFKPIFAHDDDDDEEGGVMGEGRLHAGDHEEETGRTSRPFRSRSAPNRQQQQHHPPLPLSPRRSLPRSPGLSSLFSSRRYSFGRQMDAVDGDIGAGGARETLLVPGGYGDHDNGGVATARTRGDEAPEVAEMEEARGSSSFSWTSPSPMAMSMTMPTSAHPRLSPPPPPLPPQLPLLPLFAPVRLEDGAETPVAGSERASAALPANWPLTDEMGNVLVNRDYVVR